MIDILKSFINKWEEKRGGVYVKIYDSLGFENEKIYLVQGFDVGWI